LTAFTEILLRGGIVDGGVAGDDYSIQGRSVEGEKLMMLKKLQEHISDMNSYVRAKALHLWVRLSTSKGIPMDQLGFSLVTDAAGRLNDATLMVRKAAASLLKTLLTYNPFGSDVSPIARIPHKPHNMHNG